MSGRYAVAVTVAAGAAVLVAGVASAGLLGLRSGGPPHAVPPPPPSATAAGTTPQRPPVTPAPAPDPLTPAHVDPATLPSRTVERAVVVLVAYPDDGDAQVVAYDADAGEWVLLDVPGAGGATLSGLSPDGRRMLASSWEPITLDGAPAGGTLVHTYVDLGTGQARRVPVPDPQPALAPLCRADGVAWAPDGRHVVVVSGCLVADRTGDLPPELDAWVHEVDLVTGDARLVEHVDEAFPSETSPSYSPDGRRIAYGIGHADEAAAEPTLRVVGADGDLVGEWPDTLLLPGDTWTDPRTLLTAGDGPTAALLVDTRTGGIRPAGTDATLRPVGALAGRLVVAPSPWADGPSTCAAALCLVDPDGGDVVPWLTAPPGVELGLVRHALSIVGR